MLPPVVFVLGKGGVGRSTVAAALGAGLASRGEQVLIVQWTVTDAISQWFDRPAAGSDARAIAPGLATMNFSAEASLEQYFVDHLGMRAFYRAVIANRHVRRLTRAAPGLEELMFLGTLMWLTTLARQERGWSYDHVIVDAPAMGHATSLFAIPHTTSTLGLGGLLATECERVAAMLADPAHSAAVLVTLPEELAVEETIEFWPRITHDLGRPPLAAIINRSAHQLGDAPVDPAGCGWYQAVRDAAAPTTRPGLDRIYGHLARRAGRERTLAAQVSRLAPHGTIAIDDAMLVDTAPAQRQVVQHATAALQPLWRQP
jgi:hypothetical protein